MSDNAQPTASSKPGLTKRLMFGAVAVVAIVTGLAQISRGVHEIFGDDDAALQKLLQSSDDASHEALNQAQAGEAQLDSLTAVLHSEPLESLRTNEHENLETAGKQLAAAAAQFRTAAKKLEDASAMGVNETFKEFLKDKIGLYNAYAEAYELKTKIVAAMLDASIVDKEGVIDTVRALGSKVDEVVKQAESLAAQADAAAAKLKGK